MTRFLTAIVFAFISFSAFAQTPNYASYNWQRGQSFQDSTRFNDTIILNDAWIKGLISVRRDIDFVNTHAFEDFTNVNIGTRDEINGYASFDAVPVMNNTARVDHVIGYQSRPRSTGTDTIDGVTNYVANYIHTGTGLVTNYRGINIQTPVGKANIGNIFGLVIEDFSEGFAIKTGGGFHQFLGEGSFVDSLYIDNGWSSAYTTLQAFDNSASPDFGSAPALTLASSKANQLNNDNSILFGFNSVSAGFTSMGGIRMRYSRFSGGIAGSSLDFYVRTSTSTVENALTIDDGLTATFEGDVVAANILETASAALNFPSTGAQSSSDLTITYTGAAVGDVVCLGVPNGSVLSNSSFTAWVSASNTVTVRFNNYSIGAQDPASGTFTVKILR